MKKWDVVIIGSGISSLTSAALLSKKGKSVCVLEQYNKAGGYMHCFSRHGKRFDTGAHYVGAMDPGQPFHTLLTYLKVYDDSLFVALDPDGFDVFKFPDREVQFPKGYVALIRRLCEHFPAEKDAIRTYFAQVSEAAQNFPTYEFKEDVDMAAVVRALETPLSTVVRGLTQDSALIAIFYAYCTLHGVEPEQVSFGLHAIVTDSLIRGPYGLTKGGDALTRCFVDQIHQNGGEVLLKKRVISIETAGRLASAVITADGERFESDWIIAGCHPKTTFGLVDDPSIFSQAFRERMEKIRESTGIFGIYGSTKGASHLNRLKNYYYFSSNSPEKMLEQSFPQNPPSVAFMAPASRLPENPDDFSFNIHSAAPIEWFSEWRDTKYGKRPESYDLCKQGYASQVFRLLQRYEPGLRQGLEKYSTSSPLTNIHFNGSPEGSSYGIHHSIQNTGARALGPRTHVANLLLTGQSCLFPGLLGAAVSALRTSGHIIGIKPVLKELRESRQSI